MFFSIPQEAREKTPHGAISKIPKKKEPLLFFYQSQSQNRLALIQKKQTQAHTNRHAHTLPWDTPQAWQMQGNPLMEHGQSVGNPRAIMVKNGQSGLLGGAPTQETLVRGGQYIRPKTHYYNTIWCRRQIPQQTSRIYSLELYRRECLLSLIHI